MDDQCALSKAKPPEVHAVLPELDGVQSLLMERQQQWQECLSAHPDKRFVDYTIIIGRHKERLLGWLQLYKPVMLGKPQYASSHSTPGDDTKLFMGEVGEGRMLGPFAPSSAPEVHINRMGVVLKGHVPGN